MKDEAEFYDKYWWVVPLIVLCVIILALLWWWLFRPVPPLPPVTPTATYIGKLSQTPTIAYKTPTNTYVPASPIPTNTHVIPTRTKFPTPTLYPTLTRRPTSTPRPTDEPGSVGNICGPKCNGGR